MNQNNSFKINKEKSLAKEYNSYLLKRKYQRFNKKMILIYIQGKSQGKRINFQDISDFYCKQKFQDKIEYWICGSIEKNNEPWFKILLIHKQRFDIVNLDYFNFEHKGILYQTQIDKLEGLNRKAKYHIMEFYSNHDYLEIEKMPTSNSEYQFNPFQNDKKLIGQRILQEGITCALLEDQPQLMLQNLNSLQKNHILYNNLKRQESGITPKYIFDKFIIPGERKHHVWLYGPSGSGKTTLIRYYEQHKGIITCNAYKDGYWDENINLPECGTLIFDEFDGKVQLQKLNRIMDNEFLANPKYNPTYKAQQQKKQFKSFYKSQISTLNSTKSYK